MLAPDRPRRLRLRALAAVLPVLAALSVGAEPLNATAPYPAGDLSFLDGIPPIGNKFHDVRQLGPESAPNAAAGDYHRSLYFRFH